MVVIRKARLEDISYLIKLEKKLIDEGNEIIMNSYPQHIIDFSFNGPQQSMSKKLIKNAIYSRNGLVLVSEIDNIIVGYLLLTIRKNFPIFKLKKYGKLQTIFIEEKYRNKKISTKLINRALEWCKEKGLSRVSLDVLPKNLHAIEVYQKWGFTPYSLEMRSDI
jgi:GNAT superfamily N-acetyltransferase